MSLEPVRTAQSKCKDESLRFASESNQLNINMILCHVQWIRKAWKIKKSHRNDANQCFSGVSEAIGVRIFPVPNMTGNGMSIGTHGILE